MTKNSEIIKNDPRQDEIKICSICGEQKPRKDFAISSVKPKTGTVVRRRECKICGRERQTQARRAKGIKPAFTIPTKEINGKTYYYCDVCKEYKLKSYFPSDKYKKNTIGIKRPCKACRSKQHDLERRLSVMAFDTDQEIYEHDRHYGSINKIKKQLINLARNRAKTKGLEFSITIDDISIPKMCPLLEIPIKPGIGKHSHNSPSIDRIDSNKGYTKGNVRVISYKANAMKQDASKEELFRFFKNLTEYYKDEEIVRHSSEN